MPDRSHASGTVPRDTAPLPRTPPADHSPLGVGHWWGCQFPERAPDPWNPFRVHWCRGCRNCFIHWRAAAALPRATFVFHNHEHEAPKALYPDRQSEAAVFDWFMLEGDYATANSGVAGAPSATRDEARP